MHQECMRLGIPALSRIDVPIETRRRLREPHPTPLKQEKGGRVLQTGSSPPTGYLPLLVVERLPLLAAECLPPSAAGFSRG